MWDFFQRAWITLELGYNNGEVLVRDRSTMIGGSSTHGLKIDRDLLLVLDETQTMDKRFVVRRPKL